ncbi:MAG: amidohydrolase family protein [Hyphomonadaceae bacterium]|nr:amidohydrolase family protein [Hyphomonadaceae bacterium]
MKAAINAIAAALVMAAVCPAAAETVLVRGGRVVTNTGAVLDKGDVLFTDSRIVAVGPSIAAPAGARVIDAAGRWVTPGAIAAMSELGLSEISGSGAANDASLASPLISAAAEASRAFDPSASAVAVTRIEGVTRAVIAPAATGTIFSGIGALVALNGAADSVQRDRLFQVLELGETGAERAGGSRAALWPYLEAALKDAREYPARYASGQDGAVLREIDARALKPFALGQGVFLVRTERAADIRELLRFKRANPNLKFVIHGGAEAWLVADELAAAKVPVIVDPMVNLPERMEKLAARLDNAALLERAGVRVIIAPSPGSVDGHQARLAFQLAGNAVANGLPWEAAFKAISQTPAEVFGVGGELGSLAPGKTADVVIWDGDPLDVMSAPVALFIAGVETPLVSRQTRLRDRYNPAARP